MEHVVEAIPTVAWYWPEAAVDSADEFSDTVRFPGVVPLAGVTFSQLLAAPAV
jgi:hypothetical protein